jgi:hypothetical protein
MTKFYVTKNNAFVEHSYQYIDIFDFKQKDEDCRDALKNGLIEYYYKKYAQEIIVTYSQYRNMITFKERIEIIDDTKVYYKIWINFNK